MSYTFLLEQGAESSAESFADIPVCVLSKLNLTQERSCSNDNATESSQSSQSGTTFAPSMENLGGEKSTSSVGGSPAKTLVRRVKEQELPEHVQAYGKSMHESLARFGLNISSPKTLHCFELGDLPLSSKIWPKWGMMQSGECWELGTLVRPTKETECGSWPTPTATERSGVNPNCPEKIQGLTDAVKRQTWPTPTVAEADKIPNCANYGQIGLSNHPRIRGLPTRPKEQKSRKGVAGGTKTPRNHPTPRVHDSKRMRPAEMKRNTPPLAALMENQHKTQGQLNPSWVEWLMGWLIGWTDLKPLETAKFRQWLRLHGKSCPHEQAQEILLGELF